jgi:hypothetical protein
MLDDVVSAVPRTTIRKKTCVGRKTPQKFWSPIAGKCLEVVDASSCVRTPTLLPKKLDRLTHPVSKTRGAWFLESRFSNLLCMLETGTGKTQSN